MIYALKMNSVGAFVLVGLLLLTPWRLEAKPSETCSLTVQGMTCATCPLQVKAAIGKLNGVSRVEVSLSPPRAQVVYDPAKTTPEAIAEASTKIGYPTQILTCGK